MNSVYANIVYTGSGIEKDKYLNFDESGISGLTDQPLNPVVGEYAVLTPALIDAHSHIGLARAGEPAGEREVNENLETILTLPDVLDSIQMDDPAFRDSMDQGVLYSCVLPGSLNVLSGRSAVIRHWAADTNAALVGRAGIKGALGFNVISSQNGPGKRPNTRMGAISLLKAKLEEVRRKLAKTDREGQSEAELTADQDLLADLLAGREKYRVHVHKIDDIAALLRLKEAYGLDVGVEHAGDVYRQETFEELKRQGVSVVYGPIDGFAYKVELRHRNWRNVEHLVKSGVNYGMMTDHPVTPSGSLLLQTRWLLRFGLTKEQALAAVTQNNARILGLDDKLGSLEPGKWASFIGWTGDPFDLAAAPEAAWGEGRRIY